MQKEKAYELCGIGSLAFGIITLGINIVAFACCGALFSSMTALLSVTLGIIAIIYGDEKAKKFGKIGIGIALGSFLIYLLLFLFIGATSNL